MHGTMSLKSMYLFICFFINLFYEQYKYMQASASSLIGLQMSTHWRCVNI